MYLYEKGYPTTLEFDIIHFFIFIITISVFLNSIAIYSVYKVKNKVTSDNIKIILFALNLAFTIISLPFYAVKESKILKNLSICQIFYTISDFIIIFYTNSYCFIAFSRYKCICVSNFSHARMDKRIIKRFLVFSTLISLISTANFLSSECKNFIKSLNNFEAVKSCKSLLTGKKHAYINERYSLVNQTYVANIVHVINQQKVEKVYRIVLSLVVAANLIFTICFYTLIIRYILLRNKKFATKFNSTVPNSNDRSRLDKRSSLVDFYLYLRRRTSVIINSKNLKTEIDCLKNTEYDNSIEMKPSDRMLSKNSNIEYTESTPMRVRKSHSLPFVLTGRDNFDEISSNPSPINSAVDSSKDKLRLHQSKTSKFNTKYNHIKSTKLFLSVSIDLSKHTTYIYIFIFSSFSHF